jgi:hypothetical protein
MYTENNKKAVHDDDGDDDSISPPCFNSSLPFHHPPLLLYHISCQVYLPSETLLEQCIVFLESVITAL